MRSFDIDAFASAEAVHAAPSVVPQQDDLPFDLRSFQEADVHVQADENEVRVFPPGSDAWFYGWLDPDSVIHFNLRAVQPNGLRHPYFARHKISHLAQSAIRYFDGLSSVDAIGFAWVQPFNDNQANRSDNYTNYLIARNGLLPQNFDDYESLKRQAALQTWTLQKVALPMGFTRITEVTEAGDIVRPANVKGSVRRPD